MRYKKTLIQLVSAAMLGGLAIGAQATEPPVGHSNQAPTSANDMDNAMGRDKVWEAKQWNKSQWDKMSKDEQSAYKMEHSKRWGKMSSAQQDAYRSQYKGRHNYAQPDWDKPTAVHNPEDVGGFNKGTPK